MQTELINLDSIESCLQSIRNGEEITGDLLNLSLLQTAFHNYSRSTSIQLTDYLFQLVTDSYNQSRLSESLPPSLPEDHANCLLQIQKDFSKGDSHLDAWSAVYFRYLSPVPLSIEEISSAACVAPQQLRRRLKLGLKQLATIIQRQETQYLIEHKPFGRFLPLPDYSHLVGIENKLNLLTSLIVSEDSLKIISIEGMGGIGKTSLVRALLSQPVIREYYEDVLWVSAKQKRFTDDGCFVEEINPSDTLEEIYTQLINQLGMLHLKNKTFNEKKDDIRALLENKPFLVVIDNIETVNEYTSFIPDIAKANGKSKFIITSRESLKHHPLIKRFAVDELNEDDAYTLMNEEIKRRNPNKAISIEEFRPFFRLVGGIPLAIKLGAGQLHLRPLDRVFQGFTQASGNINELYRYLYWQIWQMLTDDARHLILSFLPANPEGEDLEFLMIMSGQTEDQFFNALSELDQYSLIEVSGNVARPLYRLHRITITFLQTDLLNLWRKSS